MVSIVIHVHLLGAHMREGHSSILLQVPDGLLKHIDDDFPLPTHALLLEAYNEYLKCPEKIGMPMKPGSEHNN